MFEILTVHIVLLVSKASSMTHRFDSMNVGSRKEPVIFRNKSAYNELQDNFRAEWNYYNRKAAVPGQMHLGSLLYFPIAIHCCLPAIGT